MGNSQSKCKCHAPISEDRLLLLLYLFKLTAPALTCAAGHERCIEAKLTLHMLLRVERVMVHANHQSV